MRKQRGILIVTLICAWALVVKAQETRGTVIGQVTDSSGAVVPHAEITATAVETSVKQTTNTNNEGVYEFLYMLPGKYSITASSQGFKTTVQEVQVLIHERIKADFALEVGAVADEVK